MLNSFLISTGNYSGLLLLSALPVLAFCLTIYVFKRKVYLKTALISTLVFVLGLTYSALVKSAYSQFLVNAYQSGQGHIKINNVLVEDTKAVFELLLEKQDKKGRSGTNPVDPKNTIDVILENRSISYILAKDSEIESVYWLYVKNGGRILLGYVFDEDGIMANH